MFSFGNFSQCEMAEYDMSIRWRRRKPQVVVVESPGKFAWVWERVDKRKTTRAVRKPRPTKKELYRLGLLKTYAGKPASFFYAHERFLGGGRFKTVAPFYKEIYEILKKQALRMQKKVRKFVPSKKRVYPSNRYAALTREDTSASYIPTKEELEYKGERVVRCRRKAPDMSNITGTYAPQKKQAIRNLSLAHKLRVIIMWLQLSRVSQHASLRLAERIEYRADIAMPEMEGQQGEELVHLNAGNVVLTESNPASSTLAAKPAIELKWDKMCSSELPTDYRYLTDRWTLVKTGAWTSTSVKGAELTDFAMSLPLDIRNLGAVGTTPLRAPFDVFAYYRTDIEIKIHVNSNKFQMGQLQFSFQYMDHLRPASSFNNIYLRSQLPNVIINAGASNEATIYIPYKNISPYMMTQYGSLGKLRCFVIVPLDSGDNCPKTCGLTLYARLPNCEFVGMRDGGVKPEMEAAAAAMVTSAVIDRVIGDRNCDYPVAGTAPQYVVPTASHTWSLSSGLAAQLHNMRLIGPTSQVGRPVGIDMSETSIGVPCRTFGMIKHIEWDATSNDKNKAGYELWRCDAHPQLSKVKFYKEVVADALDLYSLPPVSVVTGLFKQWRGSLEFKFDVVCTQFHTGRILVAYIPGVSGAKAVTLEQARNSPCAEFSLQDSGSFTFVVPFISPMPWWHRKYAGPLDVDGSVAPSLVVMYVLNPLVYMDSVPKKVVFVPYVRGGADFEVSVPVQPANSVGCYNRSTIKDADKVYPDSKSIPFRVTKSQKFYNSANYICYEGSDTLGTVAGWHPSGTPMKKDKSGKLIQCYWSKAENPKYMPTVKWNEYDSKKSEWITILQSVGYVVLWYADDDKYWYGVPFPLNDDGFRRAKIVTAGLLLGKSTTQLNPFIYAFVEDSGWSSSNLDDIKFTPSIMNKTDAEALWRTTVGDPEMEERYSTINLLNPVPPLTSTGCGSFTFNENFSDLKDLCRRFQLYSDKDVILDRTFNTGEGIAVIPIIPSGLEPDVANPDSVWNYIRSGPIPMISNGYVYYRGSIRFRVIISSNDDCFDGSSVWIQHHPDTPLDSLQPQYFPNLQTDDKLKCHGYGFYIQHLNINRIIELEIPFYQSGMYGILNDFSTSAIRAKTILHFSTLGNLIIGLCTPCVTEKKTVNVQVYYSVGDDMSFSTFRGFDKVTFTDEVWKPDRIEDVDDSSFEILPRGDPEMEEASPEMWNAICSGVATTLAGMGASVMTRAAATALSTNIKKDIGKAIGDAIAERLALPLEDTIRESKRVRKELSQQVAEGFKDTVLTGLLCQLAHIAASPTLKTVAVSFASVLVQILHLTINQLTIFTQACQEFFLKTWNRFSVVVLPDAPLAGQPESDFDLDECERSMLALLFTSICTMFGCSSMTAPKGCGDLLRGINSGVCLFNNFVRLLENCGKVIKKFMKYIHAKLNPEVYLAGLLEDDCPEVEAWVKEVQFLLDARNKERFIYDRLMLARVFDATTFGALLVSNGLDERKPGGKVLWDLFKEIRKLRNDLCERGAHPDVRFETFPIWITGAPGIGKSFMVTEISNNLLQAVNHRSPGSMIYYIQPGAKYWSGVTNPSVLVSDDMFQVGGTRLEEELANVFMICSSSVLNPPMAAVEDKERRLNPLLYVMLANESFPNLGSVARTAPALYRRRKFLIEAKFTDAIEAEFPNILDASELPRARTQNFAHLQFRIANDPKSVDTAWREWMTYDNLLAVLRPRFIQHFEHERANFRQRMIFMYNLDPNFNELNLVHEIPNLQNIASLREQMDIVRQRVARQIDELNDPQREPDQDVWAYIRRFKDYVANLYNAPEMAPPNHYSMSEPGDVRVEECSIASADGPRHRMTDFDGTFNFRAAFEQEVQNMRPRHQEEIHPYYERYLERFPDLHEKFVVQIEMLPNTIKDKFKALYERYPHSEIMGIDLLLHPDGIEILEHSFANGFIQKMALAGDASTCVLMEDIDKFNTTLFEKLQFLTHETREVSSLFTFLITGNPLNNFCAPRSKGVFDGIPGQTIEAPPGFQNYVPILTPHPNRFIPTGIEELKLFFGCRTPLNNDVYSSIGANLCNRFPEMPEAIKQQFARSTSYSDLFECCNKLFLLPREMNGLIVDGEYVGYSIANILITLQCIYNPHRCDTGISYASRMSYCHLRNNLVAADGVRVTLCKQPGCKFSNELYYFLGAWYANSHAYIYVGEGDVEAAQDGCVYLSHSMDNILRLRRERRTTEALNSFKDYIKDFFVHTVPTKLWELFMFVCEWLPIIIFSLIAAYRVYQLYDFAFGAPTPPPPLNEPEANYFKFNQPKFPPKPNVPTADKMFRTPEMSVEQRQVMINRINKNAMIIYVNWVQDNERMNRNCRCLMLGGRNLLVLRHYLEEYAALVAAGYKLNVDCVFGNKLGDPVKVNIKYEELISQVAYCDKSNFCIVVLPKYFRLFPKIYPYFATRSNHNNVSGRVDMITVAGESSFDMPVGIERKFLVNATEHSSEVECDRVYSYMKRSPGLCGSVLISQSLGSGNGAIIGMHVAGSAATGRGFAEPLYQEMFSEFFNVMPTRDVLEPTVIDMSMADVKLDGNLFMYGCIPKELAHSESGKTNIVPSLLYNSVYPAVTEVNPLRPNDSRQPPGSHPLRDGCNKHGSGAVLNFELKDVEAVKEDITDRLNQIVKPIRAEVQPLTLQQAVCGDVNVPHFEALNWKSSEGFPLSSARPTWAHDKKWLFELADGEFGYKLVDIDHRLKLQLKLRDECFKKNVKPPTVYVDCLKDYRLRPEKCAKPGSTRIFSVAPIQCSIDIRQHLSDFTASLKSTHIQNSIGIGINPDSMEWTVLANYLFEVGPCIITLDYSNFGPCLMSQLVAASNECIVEWHKLNGASEEHVSRVEWLLDCDILNPVHLCSNVLYQTVNGIASGSPLTGECNSIPNLFYIRCAYLEIMREKCAEFANMYYFNLFVRIVVYGDDLIMSVSPDIIDYFNAVTVKEALGMHGIRVTSARKDENLLPYDKLENSTFLKRSFKLHPTRKGVWLAPVEVDSVQECINWMHKCDDPQGATIEVVTASLDLAYGHGPEYYNDHRARLIKACKELDLKIFSKSWYERDNEIFGENVKENVKFSSKLPWFYNLDSVDLTVSGDL